MRKFVGVGLLMLALFGLAGCAVPAAAPPLPPTGAGRLDGSSHGMPPGTEALPDAPPLTSLRVPITTIAGSTASD